MFSTEMKAFEYITYILWVDYENKRYVVANLKLLTNTLIQETSRAFKFIETAFW